MSTQPINAVELGRTIRRTAYKNIWLGCDKGAAGTVTGRSEAKDRVELEKATERT
jgi:hypothetical protein